MAYAVTWYIIMVYVNMSARVDKCLEYRARTRFMIKHTRNIEKCWFYISHELSSMEYYQPIQQITLKTIHEHILSFRLAAILKLI